MKTTREKIILGIAGVVVLYGLYALLGSSGSKGRVGTGAGTDAKLSGRKTSDQLLRWITDNQQNLSRTAISPFEGRIVQRAADSWAPDPFLDKPLPSEVKEKEEREQTLLLSRISEQEKQKAAAMKAAQEAERLRKEQMEALVRQFTYKGYVSGDTELSVVINGVAYKQGETLADYPYRIIKISPERVVLQATDQDVKINVQLEE